MAVLDHNYTYSHAIAETNPDGSLKQVVDTISQTNELLGIMPAFEQNRNDHHETLRETSQTGGDIILPNEGALKKVSETEPVTDKCIHLSAIIAPHPKVLEPINNQGEWYARKIRSTIKGNMVIVADLLINGDASNPREFNGFMTRMNSLPTAATDVTDPYYTVMSAGGSGADNTSMYLICLGEDGAHLIYPKNGMGSGLNITERTDVRETGTNGGTYFCQRHVTIDQELGLVLTNTRAAGRIANIDYSALSNDASTGANLANLMIHLKNKVYPEGLKPVWLCNNTVKSYFEAQRVNKTNVNIMHNEDFGKIMTHFAGWPILRMDAIGIAESVVS